jgi:imidazolonepropionase-like amidohydrolase
MSQKVSLICLRLFLILFGALGASAQTAPQLSSLTQEYVRVNWPRVVLTHVRVIDGTGAAAVEDQNVILQGGKIVAIEKGADVAKADNTTVLDLHGYSVMPGIVGMHNHLFYIARPDLDANLHYESPVLIPQMTFSAPRLYLAGGVTTMRTTGSVETYADLNLKRDIDSGKVPGPHLDVTGPYLEGATSIFTQMPHLENSEQVRATVDYWANMGVTSFKAYMNIPRAELKAAIDEVHRRGLKITGHLCSVTFKEAAELGIDDLEHGFSTNTEFDSGKKLDVCTASDGQETLAHMDPNGPEAKDLIQMLVSHHVAVTSTLPVAEAEAGPGRPPVRQ